MEGGRSLAETPTWSVATVTTILVGICFIVERSIHRFGEWLARTKRKPLLAALTKIKEELMLLGVMSLLLSQSARSISRFCVKSSIFSSRFYPCSREDFDKPSKNHTSISHVYPEHYQLHFSHGRRLAVINHCDEGHEPFVSYESLEQLHRFLFILGVTHVLYCCLTMLFAMIKIYSWRPWEIEAHSRLIVPEGTRSNVVMRRQTTFVFHHTEHPWSKNRFLVWVLCFARQFLRSVTKEDYRALRLGFITVLYMTVQPCFLLVHISSLSVANSAHQMHRLRLTYDFHSYMVRTMEDEFRDIVGISWPLWGYAIICIFFNLHGLNFYFWISFIPAILILFVGTKLQHVIAKLALDNAATHAAAGTQLKPRDQLFWFGKPQLLLWFIQFISFQNAFEMTAFVWSWWEIKAPTCFMKDSAFVFTRLISGVLVQFWCSYGILPLYAIVTQMGSRYKKALIREEIRESLHGWRKRVKEKAKRESLHPSSTSAKLETVSSFRDKDETSNESIAYSLSRSPRNVIERSRSLPREIHITCQTENMGEDSIHEEGRQEEELGSHSSVYSFTADNNALHTFEANVMDDDNTDEDSTEKHLLGPGSSNNGSTFELGVLEDDNIDEDLTDQHLPDPSEIP